MSRHVPLVVVVAVGGVAAWWFVTHVVPPSARRQAARGAVVRAEDLKHQDPMAPLPTAIPSVLPSPSLLLFEQEDMEGPPIGAALVELPPATQDASEQDGPPSAGVEDQGPPQDE